MTNIVNTITDETYIGIVYDNNPNTRTLEVFIPKLMPAIIEGAKPISTATNFGNQYIDIKYSDSVTSASTITVRSRDVDSPLPKVGSKVLVKFLEGNINMGFWYKFNPSNDYEVIDEEKYAKLATLKIANKEIDINTDDKIEIMLPSNFVVISYPEENKVKKIEIKDMSNITHRLDSLEDKLGTDEFTEVITDESGREIEQTVAASGLVKEINELKNEIKKLKSALITIQYGN